MNIVSIYRLSDGHNKEKQKPEYAGKEDCLRVFTREFSNDNLILFADNVKEETFDMAKKYVKEKNIYLTNFGNTGTFLASWQMAYTIAQNVSDDTIFYLVEDDYIHRSGAKDILVEAFRDLNADYVTLYDHPDKYMNNQDSRFRWGHDKVDKDVDGVRKPGIIYGTGQEDKGYISESTHWRTVGSTTMTWATTAKNVKEDFEEMNKLHTGKHLPMGGDTFRMLKDKGKDLISCLPGYSAHAEERWMPYFVNWEKEAK